LVENSTHCLFKTISREESYSDILIKIKSQFSYGVHKSGTSDKMKKKGISVAQPLNGEKESVGGKTFYNFSFVSFDLETYYI